MALVHCRDCGVEVSSNAAACVKCGSPLPGAVKLNEVPKGPAPSKLLCAFLAFFVPFGIHRFVLGYTEIGIAQVLLILPTCGLSMWWEWIDGVMILTGHLKARDGRELT